MLKVVKLPTIKGKARVGAKLTATTGSWSSKPTKVTLTWLRNGKAIKVGAKRATKKTYRLTRKDRGKKIQVKVVAWSGKSKASARSKAVRVRR